MKQNSLRNRVHTAPLLMLASLCLAGSPLALAQVSTVGSGVYPWAEVVAVAEDAAGFAILSGTTTPLKALDLHAETLKGAASHAPAVHESVEELMIVKDGLVTVTLEGAKKTVGPGSVAVLLPGIEHAFESASDSPATIYLFTYVSETAPQLGRGEEAGGSLVIDWDGVEKRETATGGRRDFFDRATAMFERFEMHVSTLNEGLTNHAAHTHGAEEFVVILQGTVEMLIGDTYRQAMEGDVIFLESLIPHALNNIGDGPTEYFAFQWQ